MTTNNTYLEDAMRFKHAYEDAVWASDTLSPKARLLALALARVCDWDTGKNATRSNQQLARMCHTSATTISRARGELVAAGFLAMPTGHMLGETCEHILSIKPGTLLFNGSEDRSAWPKFEATPLVKLTTPHSQIDHPPLQFDNPPCQIDNHTLPSPSSTRSKTKKGERAGAQSRSVAHEHTREADRSLSEQIGPEQQASELVTAEIASTVQAEVAPPVEVVTAEIASTVQAEVAPPVEVVTAEIVEIPRTVEQPPVTGQALSGEVQAKASDTPDAEAYITAVVGAIKAASSMHVRPGAWALAQLADKAKTMGWSVADLVADVQVNIADYTRRNLSWRLDWLVRDMGTRAAAAPGARANMAKHPVDDQIIGHMDRAVEYIASCWRKGDRERAERMERLLLRGVRNGTYTPTTDAHRAALADMEARHG